MVLGGFAMSFTVEEPASIRVPLILSLAGAGHSGKTWSMFELLEGMREVEGGEIAVIDTEGGRSANYEKYFKFKIIRLNAPFSSERYREAIEFAIKQGFRLIGVDGMSLEHSGEGGYLDYHEAEVQRLSRGDESKRDKVSPSAWIAPKVARRHLRDYMMHCGARLVLTFRSEEANLWNLGGQKRSEAERAGYTDPPKKGPVYLGWMPVGGKLFLYDVTVGLVLPPMAHGVPDLSPQEPGEKVFSRIPEQFKGLFKPGERITRRHGRAMVEWHQTRNVIAEPDLVADIVKELRRLSKEDAGPMAQSIFGASTPADLKKIPRPELEKGLATLREKLAGAPG
jgi:hypothetical protein